MPPYVPPESGDLPDPGKAILTAVYIKCRKANPSDAGKEKCAQIAWGAVKNAGYHQDETGHWSKAQGANERNLSERNITYLASITPLQAEGKRIAGSPRTGEDKPHDAASTLRTWPKRDTGLG
jgi:cation transport regulator ChaB